MKRTLALPLCVLAALLAFSLWNIRRMDGETDRWRAQLQQADRLALSGAWCETLDALWESYDDWSHCQTTSILSLTTTRWTMRRPCTVGPSPLRKRRRSRNFTQNCPTSGISCGSSRRWKR